MFFGFLGDSGTFLVIGAGVGAGVGADTVSLGGQPEKASVNKEMVRILKNIFH